MKIILLGAKGIMGGHVITAANKFGYEISSYVDVKCDPNVLNEYTKIADVKENADVIIDFSSINSYNHLVDGIKRRMLFC